MKFETIHFGDMIKVISSAGEELIFDVRTYKLAKALSAGDLFKTIDEFIARQSHIVQASLFGIYMEAKDIFMVSRYEEDLDKRLRDLFRRLFSLIDLGALRTYIELYSGIIVPHVIESSYADVEAGFMRDKTYIRDEYIELLTFATAVRLCLPIWGEYIGIVDPHATATGKEYNAYELLHDSALAKHPAYHKLIRYVTASMTSAVETASSTLRGVGRDKIPEWLAAVVIVRKLPSIDLYNTVNKGNIINAVYSYVDNHLKRLPKKFMDDARERRAEGGGGGSDEKDQSFIETYRAKQQISYGHLETNIVYLEQDLARCCKDIDPTFDESIVDAVLMVSSGLENEIFRNHNHLLAMWIIDKVISTLEPDTYERRITLRCMQIAQSLLHHWKLHHLALLATGIRVGDTASLTLGDHQNKPTPEEMDLLAAIYPYTIPTPNAKQSKPNRLFNYGYLAVSEMAAELTRYVYAVRVPAFLTVKDVEVDRYGHMQTPPTITHELVKLIVKLDELKETI